MRATRAVMVAGGCAAIVGAGWAASPKELPTLDLVAPSTPDPSVEAGSAPSTTPEPTLSPSPSPTPSASDDDHDDEEEAEDDHGGERDDDESDDVVTPAPSETAAPVETTEPAPAETTPAAPVAQTFDGPLVTNQRGGFQARITVEGGTVTEVQAVQAGTQEAQSVQINARAIPILRDEVLAAQTWNVAAVSGASFTSSGFVESLQGAFAKAGL